MDYLQRAKEIKFMYLRANGRLMKRVLREHLSEEMTLEQRSG